MRPKPKMLNRLPRILRSPYKQGITPRRRPQSQLIQRQALPTRLLDPRSSGSGEPQGRNADFRDGQKARVIGDGPDHDDCFLVFGGAFGGVGVGLRGGVGGITGEAGERQRWAIDAGGEQTAEDDFVEGAVCAACGFQGGMG